MIRSLCNQAKKENIAVAVSYSDFLSQQEQSITNIVSTIPRQLVAREGVPDYLHERFQEAQKEIRGRGLRLAELMGMLRVVIASVPPVFICVDALDEPFTKLSVGVSRVTTRYCSGVSYNESISHWRPHVREEDIQRYFIVAVVIPIRPNTDDI